MKLMHCSLAAVALLAGVASADSVMYYGGDYGGVALADASGGTWGGSLWVFDDFVWDGGTVTRIFGNFVTNTSSISGMEFEIRSGVSSGNGGTLVASGGGSSTWSDQHFNAFGFDLYRGVLDVADFNLAAGTYFLAIHPILADEATFSYLFDTHGNNSVGSSASGANFWQAPPFGANYLSDPFGTGGMNFSQGIYGVELVPLPPAAWAGMTTLAGLAGFRVVRRRAGR